MGGDLLQIFTAKSAGELEGEIRCNHVLAWERLKKGVRTGLACLVWWRVVFGFDDNRRIRVLCLVKGFKLVHCAARCRLGWAGTSNAAPNRIDSTKITFGF